MLQVLFGNELCDASENELILKRYIIYVYNIQVIYIVSALMSRYYI